MMPISCIFIHDCRIFDGKVEKEDPDSAPQDLYLSS